MPDLGGLTGLGQRFKFVVERLLSIMTPPTITRAQYYCTATSVVGACGRDFAYIENVPHTTTGFAPDGARARYYSNSNYTQCLQPRDTTCGRTSFMVGTFHLGIADGVWAETRPSIYEDKNGYGVSPPTAYAKLAEPSTRRLAARGAGDVDRAQGLCNMVGRGTSSAAIAMGS
ncbi:hypothetical protein [Sphingobium yanoikuyae]|uniref:hypothetical protein n=1 Tax=Sphingobium yanoikuyae TaxID=13690 RepID=UPI00345E6458